MGLAALLNAYVIQITDSDGFSDELVETVKRLASFDRVGL